MTDFDSASSVRAAVQEVIDCELGDAANRDYLVDALMGAIRDQVPSVTIRQALGSPSRCEVKRRGITVFQGLDMSATLTK